MTSNVELLPCPFCGEPAEIDTRQAFRALAGGGLQECVAIYCTGCTVQAQHCYSDHPGTDRDALRDDLIAAWNARACVAHATAAKDAEIEALRAEVDRMRNGQLLDARVIDDLANTVQELQARAERLAEVLREAADDIDAGITPEMAAAHLRARAAQPGGSDNGR